jgi:hypothetical protein
LKSSTERGCGSTDARTAGSKTASGRMQLQPLLPAQEVARHLAFLALLLCGFGAPIPAATDSPAADRCIWGRGAAALVPVPLQFNARFPSPDGKVVIFKDDLDYRAERDGRPLAGMEGYEILQTGELLWSPDSRAFAITWTEGGLQGGWILDVFLVEAHRVRHVDVTAAVTRDFRTRYHCNDSDGVVPPNNDAIAWVDGSASLLVLAELPNSTFCLDMGRLRGYLVEIPSGRILKNIPHRELVKNWSQHFCGDWLAGRLHEQEDFERYLRDHPEDEKQWGLTKRAPPD